MSVRGISPTLTPGQAEALFAAWLNVQENILQGVMEPWTSDLVASLIRAMQPEHIVELGTSIGVTTQKMLDAAAKVSKMLGQPVTFDGVDLNADRFQTAKKNLTWDKEKVVCRLHMADALKWLQKQPADSIDLILLDDDHKPEYVRQEIVAALSAVRAEGLILVHDVYSSYHLHHLVHDYKGICIPTVPAHAVGAGLGIIEVA